MEVGEGRAEREGTQTGRGRTGDTLNKDEENRADPDDRHLITLAEEVPINNS